MRIKTIVLTAVLSIMCIFTLAGCQKKIHLEEKSFTAETEIKTIVIDDESMDIEFNSSSTAKNITVDYYESSEYPLDVSVVLSSSTLRIIRNVKHTTFTPDYSWQYGCKTVVTLPKEYDGEIEVDVLNGDITVNAITAGKADFDTTNGDTLASVDLSKLNADETEKQLLAQWNNLLTEAKKTAEYDASHFLVLHRTHGKGNTHVGLA